MLALVVASALGLGVWTGWGLLVRALLVHLGFSPSPRTSLDAVVLPGLAALASMSAWVSLALPLGPPVLLALVLPLALLLRPPLRALAQEDLARLRAWAAAWPVWLWLVLGMFAAIALWRATGPAKNFDSGLYHLQAVRWIESYRVVPGLAVLHSRLGFNSHWFLAVALERLPWPGGPVRAMNAALFLVALIWAFDGIARLWTRQTGPSTIWRIAALLLLVQVPQKDLHSPDFMLWLSSLTPDMPAMVLAWWVLGACLGRAEEGSRRLDLDAMTVVLMCVFSVAVKVSAAPLVLAMLWQLARARGWSRRGVLVLVGLGAFVDVPWLARNWVLSGWPLYPLPALRLGAPDWQVPIYQLRVLSAVLTAWARQPVTYYDTVVHLSTEAWLMPWWEHREPFERLMLVLIAAAPALLGLAWALGRVRPRGATAEIGEAARSSAIFWTLAFAGVAYWFKLAPDTRYGLGFLVPAAAAGCFPWVRPLVRRGGRRFGLVLLLGLTLFGINSDVDWEASARWWRPVPYPADPPQAVKTWALHNLSVPVSESDQCWDLPLPCTCHSCFNPRMQSRGSTLGSGFRLVGTGPAADEHEPFFGKPIPPEYL